MLNPQHVLELVIRPTLEFLDLASPSAERLLLGTAITESRLRHLRQFGGGPALGLYQIEPATHRDLFENFLDYPRRHALRDRLQGLAAPSESLDRRLIANLSYATAAARLIYFRRPEALPDAGDLQAIAGYWKAHYNTSRGAGTPWHFIKSAGSHLKRLA